MITNGGLVVLLQVGQLRKAGIMVKARKQQFLMHHKFALGKPLSKSYSAQIIYNFQLSIFVLHNTGIAKFV